MNYWYTVVAFIYTDVRWRLVSAIEYRSGGGKVGQSGHFTSLVRDTPRRGWLRINDESVTFLKRFPCGLKDVRMLLMEKFGTGVQ